MTGSGHARDLDVYDVAFLAGGVQRVVDTALVTLVESGRVRVHSPGELAAVRPDRGHPVEAAVLDAIGIRHRSVDTIRWRLTRDDRVTGVGRSLASSGLLRRTIRRRQAWAPTRAGRKELQRLAARPPADPALDGGSAVLVALRGREAMPDTGLRSAIFERPALPKVTGREVNRRLWETRRRHLDDPAVSAYQTRNALGGATAMGFIEGGGGGGDG